MLSEAKHLIFDEKRERFLASLGTTWRERPLA
jgi:hypothetical protein